MICLIFLSIISVIFWGTKIPPLRANQSPLSLRWAQLYYNVGLWQTVLFALPYWLLLILLGSIGQKIWSFLVLLKVNKLVLYTTVFNEFILNKKLKYSRLQRSQRPKVRNLSRSPNRSPER
jgi:hypothetical protein